MSRVTKCLDDLVVVDAKPEDYESFVANLAHNAVHLHLCSKGEDALRVICPVASTLWLINARLADMSGTCLLTLLRRRVRRAVVVLVGDVYSADDELAARAAGATAYVCKPPTVAWLDAFRPHCRTPAIRAGPVISTVQKSSPR